MWKRLCESAGATWYWFGQEAIDGVKKIVREPKWSGYNGYLLAYFRIFFCARHTLRMRIPSYFTVLNFLTGSMFHHYLQSSACAPHKFRAIHCHTL